MYRGRMSRGCICRFRVMWGSICRFRVVRDSVMPMMRVWQAMDCMRGSMVNAVGYRGGCVSV